MTFIGLIFWVATWIVAVWVCGVLSRRFDDVLRSSCARCNDQLAKLGKQGGAA